MKKKSNINSSNPLIGSIIPSNSNNNIYSSYLTTLSTYYSNNNSSNNSSNSIRANIKVNIKAFVKAVQSREKEFGESELSNMQMEDLCNKLEPQLLTSFDHVTTYSKALYTEKRIKDAQLIIENFIVKNRNHSQANCLLGRVYIDMIKVKNDYNYKIMAARSFYDALKIAPDFQEAKDYLIKINNEIDRDISQLYEEITSTPSNLSHSELLCNSHREVFKRLEKLASRSQIRAVFEKALKLKKTNFGEHDSEIKSNLKFYIANEYFYQRKFDKAEEYCRDIIKNAGAANKEANLLLAQILDIKEQQELYFSSTTQTTSNTNKQKNQHHLTGKQIGISAKYPNRELNGKSWSQDSVDSELLGYSQPSQSSDAYLARNDSNLSVNTNISSLPTPKGDEHSPITYDAPLSENQQSEPNESTNNNNTQISPLKTRSMRKQALANNNQDLSNNSDTKADNNKKQKQSSNQITQDSIGMLSRNAATFLPAYNNYNFSSINTQNNNNKFSNTSSNYQIIIPNINIPMINLTPSNTNNQKQNTAINMSLSSTNMSTGDYNPNFSSNNSNNNTASFSITSDLNSSHIIKPKPRKRLRDELINSLEKSTERSR